MEVQRVYRVPTPPSEDLVFVAQRDWKRSIVRLRSIRGTLKYAEGFGFSLVGSGLPGIVTTFTTSSESTAPSQWSFWVVGLGFVILVFAKREVQRYSGQLSDAVDDLEHAATSFQSPAEGASLPSSTALQVPNQPTGNIAGPNAPFLNR